MPIAGLGGGNAVDAAAGDAGTAAILGFSAPVVTDMPANNLSMVFRRM
jgi:hypothetical protein